MGRNKRTFRVRYGQDRMSRESDIALRAMLRERAFYAQDTLCYWCKTPMLLNAKKGAPHSVTLEHLIPEHAGGKTTKENCVAACKQCNGERGGAFTPPHSARFAPKNT